MADDRNMRESGEPGGGVGRRDVVGGSGVYPASAGNVPDDAEVRTQAAWGQGERGAAGYEDSGRSELHFTEDELRAARGEGGSWAPWAQGESARRASDFLLGLVLGAGLMYVLDPDRGRRRRALVRDQVVHAGHELGDVVSAKARHLSNQARGVAAEAQARLRGEDVDNFVLESRVRSEIGRAVSTPGAIYVTASAGRVILRGPVLADEVERLVATVRSVRGVEEVDNRLDVHAQPGRVPALQGAAR